MAKKTRKQKQRAQQRRDFVPARPEAPAQATGTITDATASGDSEPAVETRRRVERVAPGATGSRAAQTRSRFMSTAAMFAPLESEDPAIPFDRVPYVPSDLRRVAVIAVLMLILIVVADAIISNVVK